MTSPSQDGLDRARRDAWLDGLEEDDREIARRVISMPGGSHAVAWLAVEHHRAAIRMCASVGDITGRLDELTAAIQSIQLNTSGGRKSAGVSGALIGGMIVGAIAATAKLLGMA